MKTAIVGGALANKCHNGGEAWVRLSWVLGLKRLGFDVFFLEQIAGVNCVDASGAPAPFAESANLAYFAAVMARFGLADRAALILDDGAQIHGATPEDLRERAGRAELLINISGHLTYAPVMERVGRKIYVDIDPGFTQLWHAAGNDGARLGGHDLHFTIGANLGTAACSIPTCGFAWRKTRPPVLLDQWSANGGGFDRFTTVANWRGPFGAVEFAGQTLGLKVHQFRKFIELPRRVPQTFEIALNIHPADDKDLAALHVHGWKIVEPASVAGGPEAFRSYLQNSGAEFSVAQGIYVQTRSGWFSDRTAHYLAAGRPTLVQDTGLAGHYPTGKGLIVFSTLEEAAEGAASIAADYRAHQMAARDLAAAYFDSDKVIASLLDESV